MKALLVLSLLAVAAWVGLHSQPDTGAFQIIGSTIRPVDDNPARRLIYRKPLLLSFDDGPGDAATDRTILAVLAKHHARSLWMVNCQKFAGDPTLLREIAAAGHEIGNHTYSHPRLDRLASDQLDHQITGCSQAIFTALGERPRFFRPPFGVSTPAADRVVRANGMESVLWGPNSFDSLRQSFKTHPQQYVEMLRSEPGLDPARLADSGDVLLLHDYPNTALALDGILTRLEARGFQFVVPDQEHH